MQLQIYQIDAFANKAFEGNPAAVCPLDDWLPTEMMQAIALENNLSETAFFKRDGDHHLRSRGLFAARVFRHELAPIFDGRFPFFLLEIHLPKMEQDIRCPSIKRILC